MEQLHRKRLVRHKYHAKPTEVDGIRYDSKKEARYAGQLKLLQMAGEILFYLRQVPIDLPGKIKYRVDFVEFWKNGDVKFVDVKGHMTQVSRNKIKQVEELYPIEIEIK